MWLHYPSKPINSISDIENRSYEQDWIKPIGFWISKNEEWNIWCEEHQFISLQQEWTISLQIDFTSFIQSDSIDTLISFCEQYKNTNGECGVYWYTVQKKYDGIIFENYNSIKEYLLFY